MAGVDISTDALFSMIETIESIIDEICEADQRSGLLILSAL